MQDIQADQNKDGMIVEGTVEMYVGADPNVNPNTKRGTRTPKAIV